MLSTKRSFSNLAVIVFAILLTLTACESKNDNKVNEKTVVVKDTVKSTIDTTAVPRPRETGN